MRVPCDTPSRPSGCPCKSRVVLFPSSVCVHTGGERPRVVCRLHLWRSPSPELRASDDEQLAPGINRWSIQYLDAPQFDRVFALVRPRRYAAESRARAASLG